MLDPSRIAQASEPKRGLDPSRVVPAATPAPEAEPSYGALLSGVGKVVGAVAAPIPAVGRAIGALAAGESPISASEVASLKEYGPSVVAGGAGLALPAAGVLGGTAASVLIGRGAAGMRAALTGKPVLEEMAAPYREPSLEAALEVGLPAVGGAAVKLLAMRQAAKAGTKPATEAAQGWLASGRRMTSKALHMDRPVPAMTEHELATAIAKSSHTLGQDANPLARVARAPLAAAERSDDSVAQLVGERVRRQGADYRRLREMSDRAIQPTFGRLSLDQQEAVREAIRTGTTDALPDDLRPVAQVVRNTLADAYEQLTTHGVRQRKAGEQIPVRHVEDYWPRLRDIPKDIRAQAQALAEREMISEGEALDKIIGRRREAWIGEQNAQAQGGRFLQHTRKVTDEDRARFPELPPAEQLGRYLEDVARQVSTARNYGGEIEGGFGKEIAGYLAAIKDPTERARLSDVIAAAYKPEYGPLDDLLSGVRNITGRMALTGAWARQPQQMASVLSKFGLRNAIKARKLYESDPTIRELAEVSGAGEAGLSGMIEREMGISTENLPFRMLRGTEHAMREKYAAPAGYLRLQELGARIAAGDKGADVARELAELGTSVQEVEGALAAGGGRISPTASGSLVADVMQAAADRNLLQTQGGHLPTMMEDPAVQALLQYRKFSLGQTSLMARDYLDVLREGVATKDPRMIKLGLSRLGSHLGYGAALNVPTHIAHSLLSGRLPTTARFTRDLLGGNYGLAGDVAGDAVDWVANPGQDNPAERLASMPAVGIIGAPAEGIMRAGRNAAQGDFDAAALQALAAGMRAAQAFDQRGIYSMAARPAAGAHQDLAKQVDEAKR